ncbi:MAG: RNA polymerase factor sigma-54, partial [Planctomycetota bacterium]
MRLSLGLDTRQVQVQKLAPRMIQSMEILQLPIMALQERIDQEMNDNPLLEVQEADPALPEEPVEQDNDNPDAPTENERELVVDESEQNADDFERLLNLDKDVPDHFDDGPRRSLTRVQEEADRKHDAMANVASRPESLNDYLTHQLGELDLDPETMDMAGRIVSTLDASDGGYMKMSLEDLLPADAGPDQLELARHALEIVQSLDPPGVAARDLRECLLLQLTPDMPYYEELKTLIAGHLEDLRDNRLPQIQRKTGYSIERIQQAWQRLRKLNPKPGAL